MCTSGLRKARSPLKTSVLDCLLDDTTAFTRKRTRSKRSAEPIVNKPMREFSRQRSIKQLVHDGLAFSYGPYIVTGRLPKLPGDMDNIRSKIFEEEIQRNFSPRSHERQVYKPVVPEHEYAVNIPEAFVYRQRMPFQHGYWQQDYPSYHGYENVNRGQNSKVVPMYHGDKPDYKYDIRSPRTVPGMSSDFSHEREFLYSPEDKHENHVMKNKYAHGDSYGPTAESRLPLSSRILSNKSLYMYYLYLYRWALVA